MTLVTSLVLAMLAGVCAILASDAERHGLSVYRRTFTVLAAILVVAAGWLAFTAVAT